MTPDHKTASFSTGASPLVSIIISVFNGAATIDQALGSITNQTYPHWEIIIINDASKDNTAHILSTWQRKLGSSKLTVLNNPTNIGLTKSLNLGLKQAHGQYIARLDADDFWHPDKLSRQVAWLSTHPHTGIVGSYYVNLYQQKAKPVVLPRTNRAIKRQIYRLNPFGHSCVLIRKKLLSAVGGYNPSIYYGQDLDLWFRLMPHASFYNLPAFLCYRQVNQSLSVNFSAQQMWQSITTKVRYIHLYHAPKLNYLYLLQPLTILLTPRFIKQIRNRSVYTDYYFINKQRHLALRNLHLLFINDRPLIPTRAETIARQAMYQALSKHPSIKQAHVLNITPYQALLCHIPKETNFFYLRSGAVAAASFALRNLFNHHLFILEVHNFAFGKNKLADLLYRFAAKRCHLLVTIAPSTKKNWSRHGIPSHKILVLPSGFDISLYFAKPNPSTQQLRQKLKLPLDKKIIIYAGNLYRHRGIEDIIQAARLLSSVRPDVTFFILGGRRLDQSYYQRYLHKHYPHLKNIHFLGHQKPSQVARYLMAADVTLVTYSSKCPTATTMSPIKLFEALASGTPTIVANLPRLKNIALSNLVTYYQPDDSQHLSKTIINVLDNYFYASRQAQRARSLAFTYSWSARVEKIMQALTI